MVEECMLYQSHIYFCGCLHQIEGDMNVAPLGCKFHQQIEKRGVVGERYMEKSEGWYILLNLLSPFMLFKVWLVH